MVELVESQLDELTNARGAPPDFAALDTVYCPPVAHEAFPQNEDDFQTYRIRVADVIVRYVEDDKSVTMTIEGELPQETVELLAEDLLQKFREIENSDCARRVY
jgi:hypothetical protein